LGEKEGKRRRRKRELISLILLFKEGRRERDG